jgi:DNA-binding response OmpR family regulator
MALVVVADDDELIVEMVAEALRSLGHVIGTLVDGSNVVDIVTFKRPALVILDCSMPLLSGIEALRQIRRSAIGFRIPVLMLTARRSAADEQIAMRAGANDYMRKPFDPAELVVRAESLILEGENRSRTFAAEPTAHRRFAQPR